MGETPTRSTCVTSWGSTTCRAARSASRWRGWRRRRPRSERALAPSSALQEKIAGQVIGPGDSDYEQARRVWNAIADRRPAFIVRPSSVDDVIAAVRFAREERLVVAVRGGGHSVAGFSTCDGGMVLDMSRMREVTVDPVRRTARAQGGAHLSQLDKAAQAHGLVCPVGVIGHTGVAGLTLGGGMGRLQRKHGLTVDNLLAVDLVTADSQKIRASDEENPDLFWGLRGAGANFGVATSFEFRLHPLEGTVFVGTVAFPVDRSLEIAPRVREFVATHGPRGGIPSRRAPSCRCGRTGARWVGSRTTRWRTRGGPPPSTSAPSSPGPTRRMTRPGSRGDARRSER